jgi:hypothetical protein
LSKRKRFSRLGTLSIALLLTLCVMGVGYAAWTDEASIQGTAKMGFIEVELSPGACSDPEIISCYVSAPHTLVVTLTNPHAGNYTCGFTITNTGTLPVKIQSIVTSGDLTDVMVSVSGVTEGTQIEQAGVDPDSFDGSVIITVQASCEKTFSINVAFSFVQWNMYIE